MDLLAIQIDLSAATLPSEWLSKNTHASADTIKNWTKRGHIVAGIPARGKGRTGYFSVAEAVKTDLMAYVAAHGVELDLGRRLADAMVRLLQERQASGFAFDWSERFALAPAAPLADFGPSWWREFGELSAELPAIGDLDNWTREDLAAAAMADGEEPATWIVVPVGYLVNRILVRAMETR